MSIDGLLTFVGLIAALLALATDARRQALLLRLGATIGLTAVFGVLVLYLELFSVFAPTCAWSAATCRVLILDVPEAWITPQQLAFVLVLFWLALMILNLQRQALRPRHLPRLLALATALTDERRFSELCRVTQPHLALITQIASGEGRATHTQREAAGALQWLLYRRPELVRFVALERPRMAVALLAANASIVFDFADRVLSLLIAHSESPLFTEVAENQNHFRDGYDFPERNTYLHFLFGDAQQANRLGAWRPVMETTLTHLGEARGQPYQTFLNGPADRFDELKWRDPTFVAIRYLDLMVDAALHQGIAWHMWLFYAQDLTESLLELYDDPRRDEEVFDEWPTRNAYLLYAIFGALTGWIGAVDALPDESPHLVLENERASHENGNIPKSAIIALGDCLRQVLMSDETSDRFKCYLAEIVFRTLDKLPREGTRSGFRRILIASLIGGGAMGAKDHLATLRGCLSDADHLLRDRIADLGTALDDALGVWPR